MICRGAAIKTCIAGGVSSVGRLGNARRRIVRHRQRCTAMNDDRIPIVNKELPTQGDAMVAGVDPIDYINQQLQDILKPPDTEDYLAV